MHLILIVLTLFSISSFSQTTTTLDPKESALHAYETREAAFKRNERMKKIAQQRREEMSEKQRGFKKQRDTLTEAYQSDLKKIEQNERRAIEELNRKYDDLVRTEK
jgi:hypothetical protein